MKKDIVKTEWITRILIPQKFTKNVEGDRIDIFGILDQSESNICRLHIDNEGNTIFVNEKHKLFMLNKKEMWGKFHEYTSKAKWAFYLLDFFKIGQGLIVYKSESNIFYIEYSGSDLKNCKVLEHKAFYIKNVCEMVHMQVPNSKAKVIFFYKMKDCITIIIWDIKHKREHRHFLSRKEDSFTEYVTCKSSDLGFAWFNNYIVNLDVWIPIPFMQKLQRAPIHLWCQGTRINYDEDVLLSWGTVITPLWYKDIHYHGNKSLANLDFQKLVSSIP